MMMLDFNPIFLFGAIWVLQRIWKAYRKSQARKSGAPAAGTVATEAGAGGTVPAVTRGYGDYFQIYLSRLDAITARLNQLLAATGRLQPAVGERLASVLEDGLRPAGRDLAQRTAELAGLTDETPDSELVSEMHAIAARIGALDRQTGAIGVMIDQRLDPDLRAVLGDADALAEACYRPILDFSRHHGVPIESNMPLTLIYQGGVDLHHDFLPYRLAPIALPRSYASEPWRWPAIAHEIAHDLMASVPGLREEFIEHMGFTGEAAEVEPEPGSDAFNRLLCRTWIDELFADAIGALMIGPAYLRSMTAIFARPQSPLEVTVIPLSNEGLIDHHPPRHVRVHLTAHFLHRMGHAGRARDLRHDWDGRHGEPESMLLLAPHAQRPIPATPLIDLGTECMDLLYNAELQVLAGHRLADIPGLEFATTHTRRAAEAQRRLAAGKPAAFDARSLIAAATEAVLDDPARREQIRVAVQQSIVGVGTEERVASVRAMAARPPATPAVDVWAVGRAPAVPATDVWAVARPRGGRRARRRAGVRGPLHAGVLAPLQPLATERIVDALLLGELLETRAGHRRITPIRTI